MIYEWKPEENGEFEGKVKLDIPKYTQRLKYIRECNFKVKTNEKGEMVVDAGLEGLDSIIKMVEIAAKHVKDVDLKHKESSKEFKTFDSLEDDPVCDGVLSEIGSMVINGPALGKH